MYSTSRRRHEEMVVRNEREKEKRTRSKRNLDRKRDELALMEESVIQNLQEAPSFEKEDFFVEIGKVFLILLKMEIVDEVEYDEYGESKEEKETTTVHTNFGRSIAATRKKGKSSLKSTYIGTEVLLSFLMIIMKKKWIILNGREGHFFLFVEQQIYLYIFHRKHELQIDREQTEDLSHLLHQIGF